MNSYGIGGIAETLHPIGGIYGNIEDLAYAELEFHAILHGGIDATQVFFAVAHLGLEPCKQVEGTLPCADRIPDDTDVPDHGLHFPDFSFQRIYLSLKDIPFCFQVLDNLFFVTTIQ